MKNISTISITDKDNNVVSDGRILVRKRVIELFGIKVFTISYYYDQLKKRTMPK